MSPLEYNYPILRRIACDIKQKVGCGLFYASVESTLFLPGNFSFSHATDVHYAIHNRRNQQQRLQRVDESHAGKG